MLFFDGAAGLVVLALWVFCILDVITADEASVRNLPKLVWVLIVIFLFEIGAVLWLIAGRPRASRQPTAYGAGSAIPPEYDRPGRATAHSPDDDAAWLAHLKERADAQRKKAAEDARRLREQEDEPPRSG